ncbi:MAG: pilin [Candidatus Gracilibacteria bacterium]
MKKSVLSKLGKSLFGGVAVALMVLNMQGVVFAVLAPDGQGAAEGADQASSVSTTTSVLPAAAVDADCVDKYNPDVQGKDNIETILNGSEQDQVNAVLGCGIKTGNIKLYMVPYYIRSVLEFIIGISGLICVGAIVFGGYWYLFAGVSEDKERGKKAILYGLIGMVLTLVAWAVVNIVISLLTM